jgi:hypothetical protein
MKQLTCRIAVLQLLLLLLLLSPASLTALCPTDKFNR